MEDTECIYDAVRQLVAVSPKKTRYDSKESVLFIFNKPLLVDSGPYEVEFKGEQHCLRVPAVLLNSCVIQVHAPVYYPPETTIVSIYDKVKQHEPFIARCSFEFFSRSQVLDELLEKASCPERLLCDSLGVSTANMTMVDQMIACKIQQKTPHGFHLLEIPQTGQVEVSAQSTTIYPTLIHFGAAQGLKLTVAACLRYCPAARQACALQNKHGMCPKELAEKYGHFELSEDLQDFELKEQNYTKNIPSKQMEVINNNEEDSQVGYVVMGPEIHLGESEEQQSGYMEMSGPENHETEIAMNPELWKAIFIAQQAVNQSWRNSDISEETAKEFSQFIQRSAREHREELIYDLPRKEMGRAPALPPKHPHRLNNKRHSIHDIPSHSNAPPLPPRSPRSPRSPISPSFFLSKQGIGERCGSDPNIYTRMQPQFNQQPIREETTARPPGSPQSPQLPAKPKCPLAHRGINGLPRHPDFPNIFLRQKSHSIDVPSVGFSPRLPPRSPHRGHHNRSLSFEPEVPVPEVPVPNPVKSRTLSEHR